MEQSEPDTDGRILRARALREKRKTEILSAARQVFAGKGYHAGSIADIIDAAGVARGTFYLYFEGKRAIFEEILDALLEQLRSCVRPVDVLSEVPPERQLADSIRMVLDIFHESPDLTHILFRQALGLDREFDHKLADFYEHILQMIRNSLEIGVQLQLVRPLDPRITAYFILGSVKEALIAALLDGAPELSDLDTIALEIVRYNLWGLFR